MPDPALADRARLLQPHAGGCRIRRFDPCAPLSVPILPAHGIAVAGVCLALRALQYCDHRAVSGGSPTPGRHSGSSGRGRSPVCHALPARPVLDSPLSTPGRCPLHGVSGVGRATTRRELRPPRAGHVAFHRVDSCPPLPVC